MTPPADPARHGTVILCLAGPVTGAACPGLRDAVLCRLPEDMNHVLVDAAMVTAIDDAVFAVLLAAGAWLRTRGGRLGFLSASASVRRSLAALGLAGLLPVFDHAEAAAFLAGVAAVPAIPTQRTATRTTAAVWA